MSFGEPQTLQCPLNYREFSRNVANVIWPDFHAWYFWFSQVCPKSLHYEIRSSISLVYKLLSESNFVDWSNALLSLP